MATFTTVQLPDDSTNTGKLEDHVFVDTDKAREVVVLGDPVTRASVTAVQASDPVGTEFGPVVRDVHTPAIDIATTAIASKTPALGQAAMAASVPVVIANNQSAIPATVSGVSTAANQATQITAEQATATSAASIDTKTPSLGQAAMAASSPVVIASNQSAVPVSAATLPLPSGAATSANQSTQITAEQATATSVASVDTKLGEVQASPTANTVLARLKDLLTGIVLAAGSATIGSIASITTSVTPGTAAANLGKTANATFSAGDALVGVLAVANEAHNTLNNNDGDYCPVATDRRGAVQVIGNRAHDDVDAGGPVKLGAKAIAFGANPTAVAAADRTDLYANRAGVPFVLGGHPNIVTIEAEYTAAQTNTAIVTVSSGLKIVVTAITAIVSAATTVTVGLRVGFAATTTPTTTGVVLTHPGILALSGSGIGEGHGGGIIGVGADGEDLRITSDVPTTGALRVRVSYFTIES